MSWFGGAAPEPEPEPQASPTLDRDPTSERASGALKALRQALSAAVTAAELEAALPGTDDFTLLRFLIAREFDVEAATAMVTDRVRWAGEVGLAAILAEWRGGEGGKPTTARARAAESIFYAAVFGVSVSGAPLMVERLGKADLAGVNREGEDLLQLLLKSYIAYLETVFRTLTAESVKKQELVRSVCIVDAAGCSTSTLWNINVVKAVAAIGPAYYPEMTERALILQAPWVVAKIWVVVALLLPAATAAKVAIVEATAEATAAALDGVVEMASVPDFIEGGGAPVSADPDLCPTSLVPEGLMQQLQEAEAEAEPEQEPELEAELEAEAGGGVAGVDESIEVTPAA